MIDLGFIKFDSQTLILWFSRGLFIFIGTIYIIYVILQLRQIGIMNNTLKTKASIPIAIIGVIHLLLVISVLIFVEVYLFTQ